ncbi:hypothetical protein AA0113_g6712 [Alternaria arborescens]|uniref:Uncharacterized protein n=2 Tax=Alternaria sect. Alternaria TaxID=2499237 RepID=A0A4Q4RXF8_9PLEO|nr:hypothetical protein AA0112_g12017 [Alternaria arborescens]RYN87284.1 hypothetical protein AA0119_g12496 [Alternaria tenuissima]RYO04340.1 hypothetical protein AA0121_g12839 [Alternaria tenuissima]RYO61676.1 hypothetical protein AA0113_g6712 [Alternaria arborescens]RYO62063.1 hypothetical protein AA0116_g5202 [Alternaria tenuissima]
MSELRLHRVRQDVSVTVYTEHTDHIHPRVLSENLAKDVGTGRFRVSLRKDIYIIYINAEKHEGDIKQVTLSDDGEEQGRSTIEPPTYEQRLEDFKRAEKILCASGSSHK